MRRPKWLEFIRQSTREERAVQRIPEMCGGSSGILGRGMISTCV